MTNTPPTWLPELIDTDGSWDEILQRLYAVFTHDFVTGKPRYQGLPVWYDRRKLDGDPHEEGFWHLVTKTDRNSGHRLLDTPRAKRLRWCRATIDNSTPPMSWSSTTKKARDSFGGISGFTSVTIS